jgi:hypothetical protein
MRFFASFTLLSVILMMRTEPVFADIFSDFDEDVDDPLSDSLHFKNHQVSCAKNKIRNNQCMWEKTFYFLFC